MASNDNWPGIVHVTTQEYITKEEVNILRNHKISAMLKQRGRISFNHHGLFMDWPVRFKQAAMTGYADGDTMTFQANDRHKRATLDWRGYNMADLLTKKRRLENDGTEAIINLYANLVEMMMLDIKEQFNDEFYIDGNAAANLKRMHGIESVFAGATSQAGNYVGVNAATYAGISTVLGNYGGNWTGTWPTGTGDAHYDFWSPLVVDTTNTAWQAATKTWPNTCKEALRYGIIKNKKNKGKDGSLDMILANDELYRQFLNALDAEERLVVRRGEKDSLYELGFQDTVNYDGVEIGYEYGVPSGLAYGWSVMNVELRSMQDKLFVVEGPVENIADKSYRYAVDAFLNMRINPRYQAKFIALS